MNIFYKANSTPVKIILSSDGYKEIFNQIIKCRGEKIDTLIINSTNGYVFINPLDIVHCDNSENN